MKQKTYVSIDVETTGVDSRLDEILEVGAVKFKDDGKIIKTYRRRFKSHFSIPKEATAINGITDADVASKRYYDERGASSEIKDMCEGTSLIGYNINFDLSFLKFRSVKIAQAIDVMEMVRNVVGKRIRLEQACKYMHLEVDDLLAYPRSGVQEVGYHSALTDALQTMRLFIKLGKPIEQSQTTITFAEKEQPVIVAPEPVLAISSSNNTAPDLSWPQDRPSMYKDILIIPFGCDPKYHWWIEGNKIKLEDIVKEIKERV